MLSHFNIKRFFNLRGAALKDYFDELHLDSVIPKLIQYLTSFGFSDNVVWLTKDEYLRIHSVKDDSAELEPEQYLNRQFNLQTFKPVAEEKIAEVIRRFKIDSSISQIVSVGEQQHILHPVIYKKSKDPIAYLLFLDVKKNKVKKVINKFSKDLSAMAKHIYFSLSHWESQRLSFIDDLTGLYNQKYLQMVLENEIHRAQRESQVFTVLFMDVDFFKAVNDTRGHWVGSRLLIEIAKVLKANIRRSDYAFRYGGDEFVIVLPFADEKQALLAAERLRATIEKTEFVIDGQLLQLTLSIGLASYPNHARTYKDIIKMADEAMYCGKHKSRNVVFVAS